MSERVHRAAPAAAGIRALRRQRLFARLWIALLASAACWPAAVCSAFADHGAVLLVGSSSMNGAFGHLMAKDFEQLGFQVTRRGYTSAGLARPDFRDIRELLAQIPFEKAPAAVLLYFGGNDAQSIWLRPEERTQLGVERPWLSWRDERWDQIYEARVKDLVDSLCARDARHVLVVAPADVKRSSLQARLPRIRASLRRATTSTTCGHYVSTKGDIESFSPRKHVLRTRDGVHMTRTGALRVWQRVRDQVVTLLDKTRGNRSATNTCGPTTSDPERAILWSRGS